MKTREKSLAKKMRKIIKGEVSKGRKKSSAGCTTPQFLSVQMADTPYLGHRVYRALSVSGNLICIGQSGSRVRSLFFLPLHRSIAIEWI